MMGNIASCPVDRHMEIPCRELNKQVQGPELKESIFESSAYEWYLKPWN